jgi:hypothetical protein
MAADVAVAYSPFKIAKLLCRVKTYSLMRVVAVLTARSDGSQALGEEVNGKVVPAEPYLRDSSVHKDPGSNYITDSIKLLNTQLLQGGASFGLDVDNIEYVLEANDMLHTRECDVAGDATTVEFINMRAAEPGSPYKDRVILLYRWGANPNQTTQSGCSDVNSPYILLPGRHRVWGFYLDGQPQYQNNLLTHEFGHFMGLPHTFPTVTYDLENLTYCSKTLVPGQPPLVGNANRWPLRIENLVHMTGVTPGDLEQQKKHAEDVIPLSHGGEWFDYDRYHGVFGPPIEDTPADLGWGLPLVWGDRACSDTRVYQFTRYAPGDLDPQTDAAGKAVDWKPKPGATPTISETVTLDATLRQNFMSYFVCDQSTMRYSHDQVGRMQWVLANHRNGLVGRTVTTRSAGCAALTVSARAFEPFPVSTRAGRAAAAGWDLLIARLLARRSELARLLDRNLLLPRYLWDAGARRKHLAVLERSGTLATMEETAQAQPWCAVGH